MIEAAEIQCLLKVPQKACMVAESMQGQMQQINNKVVSNAAVRCDMLIRNPRITLNVNGELLLYKLDTTECTEKHC